MRDVSRLPQYRNARNHLDVFVRLYEDHRADTRGLCVACSHGYGYPVPHLCRTLMAAPTIAQLNCAQGEARPASQWPGAPNSTEPEPHH